MVNNKRSWTVEQLKTAVSSSISMNDTLRKLNLSVSPGNHQNISRWVKEYGIDKSHFKGRSHGTSRPPNAKPLTEYLMLDGAFISSSSLRQKVLKAGLLKNECSKCGIPAIWNNEPLTLQLDHINGNPFDNRLENLRILCPNCHTQTESFGKGGRYSPKKCECGKRISKLALHCAKCAAAPAKKGDGAKIGKTDTNWPPVVELIEAVKKHGYVKTAKTLGVSDNGLRRHILRNSK